MSLTSSKAELQRRLNVRVSGTDNTGLSLLFVHGLGCDQAMWRYVAPHFETQARVIRMDLMGFGASQQSEWTADRYAGLEGHAQDVAAVADAFGQGRCVVVGHSVSGMLGLLADPLAPDSIVGHAMVAPSPCYLNDGAYRGGFDSEVLDQTLALIEADAEAWTQAMMPLLLASNIEDPHAGELTAAFCRARPQALVQLARATFRGDLRGRLAQLHKPVLVLQCDDDMVAPRAVGEFMAVHLPHARLRMIHNQGHCPHLTVPQACIEAIAEFVQTLPRQADMPRAAMGSKPPPELHLA